MAWILLIHHLDSTCSVGIRATGIFFNIQSFFLWLKLHSLNLRFPEWTLGSQPPTSSDCTHRTRGRTDAGGVSIIFICFTHCFWSPSRYLLRYCLQDKLCSSKNFSSGILLGLSTITNVYTQNHPSATGAFWLDSHLDLSCLHVVRCEHLESTKEASLRFPSPPYTQTWWLLPWLLSGWARF